MSDLPRDPDALGSSLADGWGAAEMPNDSNCLRLRAVIVPRGRRPGEAPPSSWAESLVQQGLEPAWTFDEAFAAYNRVQNAMWRYVQRHAPVQDDAAVVVSETTVTGGEQTPVSESRGQSLPVPHVQAQAIRHSLAEHRKHTARSPGPKDHLHVSPRGMDFIFEEETHGHLTRTAHTHWPGGESGVTLGPGYDLAFRTPREIISDLLQIGVGLDQARILSKAGKADPSSKHGLLGEEARSFAEKHRDVVTLSKSQQQALLQKALPQYEGQVKNIVKTPLAQSEFDALVSFDYSRGYERLRRVWSVLQKEDRIKASEFIRHFDDNLGNGYAWRREREANMFLNLESEGVESK